MKNNDENKFHWSLLMRAVLAPLIVSVFIPCSAAKTTTSPTDALGAHVNSGRGCPACHTPHTIACEEHRAFARKADPVGEMRWGEDVTSTYAAYGNSSHQDAMAEAPDFGGVLRCLTCHDGNYGSRAMMRNVVYETTLLSHASVDAVPTLMDRESLIAGHEIGDHPVGLDAQVRCGGALGWDCTERNGVITMVGSRSSRFVANYGYFVEPRHHGDMSVVACITCHNPHLMTITRVTASSASNLFPPGVYATRHFLRAPYDLSDRAGPNSNRAAQFCRQCHADKSNEMNGSQAISYE